ncbi:hypothetical protein C1I98_39040, partial [Spongiactinospora gelatinilytica]
MNAGTGRVGRHVTSRIRVRGWLRTRSPLHVGGVGDDPSDPLPIARDGLGRLYVPGTSLAGVLRNWSRGRDDTGDGLAELWGDAVTGHAARVFVADALIANDTRQDDRTPLLGLSDLEYRPSVGIDRVTGTAAQEFLYGRAVVPAGHYLRLEIDIESRDEAARDEARMGAMLAALAAGEIRLGAATGRGYGAV